MARTTSTKSASSKQQAASAGGKRHAAGSRNIPQLIFGDLWEYDPAPETADPKIKPQYDLFIGGKFVSPKSGKYFDSINPATEKVVSRIALANSEDVNDAYEAAKKAYDNVWSKMSGKERGKYIYRIARLLQDRAREFAVAESIDGGKPIKESRDFDVPMAAAHFFYHAGWADKLDYAFPGAHAKPLGVVGQVIPWNFPLLMGHPIAAKVAFTGSTEVGKRIMRQVAGTDKKMTMELGGKAANIVFDDSPIDQAVEGVVNGIFFNQGHVCCAGSR